MISYRRSFVLSGFFSALLVVLLAACDMGLTSRPARPAGTSVEVAAPQATPTIPDTATGPEETATAAAPAPTAAPSPTPEPSVAQGGTLTLRIREPIADLKPWDLRTRGEEYAAALLYNGLVQLDEALRPQPDLAERWEASEDGRRLTFTLRPGVQWHDGQPLTADDVAWTLNTLRTISATNSLLYDLQTVIGDVQTPVSNTVVLSLTQAYAPLLADLAVPILPRHRLENRSPEQLSQLNFWDEAIGSGPFSLGERSDEGISFVRNDAYFRGRPNLDGVALVVAPDDDVAVNAINDGTLLLAEFPPTTIITSEIQGLEPSMLLNNYSENGSYFLAFNVRAERVFSDTRVRRALALALDVPQMVGEVLGARGEPLLTSIPSVAWAYPADLEAPQPDIARAQELLEDAGWTPPPGQIIRERDGQPLVAQIFMRGDDPRRVAIAERIAAAAQQIGMQLEVAPSDFQTVMLPKLAKPYEFDLILSSWVNARNSTGYPTNRFYDPDDYPIFGAEYVWAGPGDTRSGLRNIGGFSNADYEREAKAARSIYDPGERAARIAEAQAVILRERPYIFLWADRIAVALSPTVRADGGEIDLTSPQFLWNVERWYLEPE